jgi:serine/threonine protein kinase
MFVRIIDLSDPEQRKVLSFHKTEVQILQRLHHANIVKIGDVFEDQFFYLYTINPYFCKVVSDDFVEQVPSLSFSLLSALNHCHERGIMHGRIGMYQNDFDQLCSFWGEQEIRKIYKLGEPSNGLNVNFPEWSAPEVHK